MKRLFALLLAILLCCTLFACGKKEASSSAKNAAGENSVADYNSSAIGRLADENGFVYAIRDTNGYILQFTDEAQLVNRADWDGMNDFVDLNPESYDYCTAGTFEIQNDTQVRVKGAQEDDFLLLTLVYTDPQQNYLVYSDGSAQEYDLIHYVIFSTGAFLENYAATIKKAFADEPITGEIDPLFVEAMHSFDGLIAFLDACR